VEGIGTERAWPHGEAASLALDVEHCLGRVLVEVAMQAQDEVEACGIGQDALREFIVDHALDADMGAGFDL